MIDEPAPLALDDDGWLERLRARLLPIDHVWDEPPFSDYDLVGGRPVGPTLRDAAVLVALVRRETGLQVILTRRAAALSNHAGQIAFPGGRVEPGDGSLARTALREAHEEIGLDPDLVEVLGASEPYETVTAFRVTPIVGLIEAEPILTPDPREVADVFEVPFAFFMDPTNHETHARAWRGLTRRYYAMPFADRYVWGATAGMLRALWLRLAT